MDARSALMQGESADFLTLSTRLFARVMGAKQGVGG